MEFFPWKEQKEKMFLRWLSFIYFVIGGTPAAAVSEALEFQQFATLFGKSHYPPLISCGALYIAQSVSACFRITLLLVQKDFSPQLKTKPISIAHNP